MIKICDKAIIKPLLMIYKNCIDTDIFPDIWNKCNIVPVHKKEDKQLTKLQTSFFFYLFLEKNLRKFCSNQYLNICRKITCVVKISQVFDHMIHMNISFSL